MKDQERMSRLRAEIEIFAAPAKIIKEKFNIFWNAWKRPDSDSTDEYLTNCFGEWEKYHAFNKDIFNDYGNEFEIEIEEIKTLLQVGIIAKDKIISCVGNSYYVDLNMVHTYMDRSSDLEQELLDLEINELEAQIEEDKIFSKEVAKQEKVFQLKIEEEKKPKKKRKEIEDLDAIYCSSCQSAPCMCSDPD